LYKDTVFGKALFVTGVTNIEEAAKLTTFATFSESLNKKNRDEDHIN